MSESNKNIVMSAVVFLGFFLDHRLYYQCILVHSKLTGCDEDHRENEVNPNRFLLGTRLSLKRYPIAHENITIFQIK